MSKEQEAMRAEFEAWFSDFGLDEESPERLVSSRAVLDGEPGYSLKDADGIIEEEVSFVATVAFLAWQASRDALVIKLPPPVDSYEPHDIDHCRAAIEAAGIKVKP